MASKAKTNMTKQTESYTSSRYNSLNHGVLSRLKVLPWEDPQELEEIQNSFLEDHQPIGATETYLVLELANMAFRRQRAYQAENALIYKRLHGLDGYSFSRHTAKEAGFLTKEACKQGDYKNQDSLKDVFCNDFESDQLEINRRNQIIQDIQKLIKTNLSYAEMLNKLDSDFLELWQQRLEYDEDRDYTATKQSLIDCLEEHVIKWNREKNASIKARPSVKQHAIGCAYIPDERTETLQRYETTLDRRFERILSMLLKLQSVRKENSLITVNQTSA